MARMNDLPPRKLTFQVVRRNEISGEVDSRRLILRRGRVESKLHIILKILAYLYFWEEELVIEPLIRVNRYRPDLVSWRESEIPTKLEKIPDLWIECKQVKIKKLSKLSRTLPLSKIVWVHTFQSLSRVMNNAKSKIKYQLTSNVHMIGIDASPVTWNSLEESISTKSLRWEVTLHEKNFMTIFTSSKSINEVSLRFHSFSFPCIKEINLQS